MIKTFKNVGTKDIFYRIFSKESRNILPQHLHKIAFARLIILDNCDSLTEISGNNGFRLHKLKNDRNDQFSIRINNKYRICFNWIMGDAFNVEIIDYH